MSRPILIGFIGIVLSGCASNDIVPTDKVRDEAAAIAIGQKECGQGTKAGWAYTWHAERDDNDWKVWSGPEYDGHHVMELKINKTTGEATDCLRYAG